jgi:membrane-associated PAP2 superfamily phosphatase
VLSIALIPLLAGQLKATTGVYCPAEISRYGGTQPYIRLLDHRPAFTRSAGTGHCFPCGHASGGFALFALIGLARSRRGQWSAFGLAMLAGWAMGAYQMAKGAHYLSHVLVTMLLAWIVFLLLRRLLRVQSIDAVGSTGRV